MSPTCSSAARGPSTPHSFASARASSSSAKHLTSSRPCPTLPGRYPQVPSCSSLRANTSSPSGYEESTRTFRPAAARVRLGHRPGHHLQGCLLGILRPLRRWSIARRVCVRVMCDCSSVYSEALAKELFGDGSAIDPSRASAVFFSIHGEQPLGDMLAGGDYDGDDYYILQERELIELFERGERSESASAMPTLGAQAGGGRGGSGGASGSGGDGRSGGGSGSGGGGMPASGSGMPARPRDLEAALHAHFLKLRHDSSAAAGNAEVHHEAAADQLGLHHPVTQELGGMYLDLLDGLGDPKQQVEALKALRNQIGPRPRWMRVHGRGGDAAWYSAESGSALARLAEFVPVGGGKLSLRSGGRLRMDPLLMLKQHLSPTLGEEALQEIKAKWKRKYKEYRARVAKLKKRQEDEERKRAPHRVGDARLAGGGGGDGGGGPEAFAHTGTGSTEWDHESEWIDSYYELVAQMREHELLAPYEEARRASPWRSRRVFSPRRVPFTRSCTMRRTTPRGSRPTPTTTRPLRGTCVAICCCTCARRGSAARATHRVRSSVNPL